MTQAEIDFINAVLQSSNPTASYEKLLALAGEEGTAKYLISSQYLQLKASYLQGLPTVGASGDVVTSDGTAWISAPASGGGGGTDPRLPSPGASGNVLTSTGSAWINSTPAAGGGEPFNYTIGTPATLPASGQVQIFASAVFSNAVPAMTSNTAPSGVCSAESILGGDMTTAYWFFRQSDNGNISDNTAVPHWIQYQFPTSRVALGWSMIPWSVDAFPDRTPYDFKFQGSNDGNVWTDLDSRTAFTDWTLNTRKYFWLSGQTSSYSYYRLYVTAQRTGNILGAKMIEIYTAGVGYEMYVRDSLNNVKKITSTLQ